MDDPTFTIVRVDHTPWAPISAVMLARMRANEFACETQGRLLADYLSAGAIAQLRVPASIPAEQMFNACSWLVQNGYELEQRERLEQTAAQQRAGGATHRHEWRLVRAPTVVSVQSSLF
jgi:hypothetical protein